MRGIRVLGVPLNVEEKHLKIYFSKKENNGGAIESIYYPLTNNDAVITFKGTEVVKRLLEIDHTLKSSTLKIHRLPENMVFTSLEAKLSSDVSAFIIATPDLHDQIRYVEDIDIISTGAETQEGSADQTLCFRGNWFQLERAWHMLDCIMQQQGHFSQPGDEMSDDRSFKQPYPTNRPLEKTDVQNRAARKQQRRRPEQLGVDMFGKVETGFIKPDPSDQVSGSKPMGSLEHIKSAFYGMSLKTNIDDHKMSQDSITTGLSEKNRFRKGGTHMMRGIRVLNIPKDVEEKELKIYFSKQENYGSTIETIYYPLTNNDAVVIFEKAEVMDQLLKIRHYLKASKLTIQRLPENQIFMSMEAKLGSEVSALIIATPKLQNQIRYGENIKIISSEAQTSNQTLRLRGNWFQLEWAWHLLDDIMQQQEIIQSKLTQQEDRKFETRSTKLSHTANGLEQFDDSPRSLEQSGGPYRSLKQFDDPPRSPEQSGGPYRETRKDHTQSEQMSFDGSRRLDNGFKKSHHEDIVADKQRFQSLKQNISASYGSTDEADTDDELRGIGYQIPSDSLSMTQTSNSKPHRYKDENDTFEKFSSIRSYQKVAEESSRRQNSEHSSAFSGAYGTENYKRGLGDAREDHYFSSLPVDLNNVKSSSHEMNIDDILKKYSYRNSESNTKPGINSSLSPTDDMAGVRISRREAPEARHSPYDSKFQHLRDDKERLGSSVTQVPLQSSYSTDDRSFKTDIKGIQVAIYHGSLLEEDTEAIVNAANEQLEHYGGIAYAIAKARGPEINTECRKYIREHGSLKKTEAMCTSGGGRIKADYIIHAAGPMWLSLWKETFHQELTRTFLNCFRLAEKLSLTSIAVPAISTGVYGAPLDECIKSFIDAVLLFSQEQKRLTDIRMLNNDAENAVTSIVLMKTILEAPIDQLMKHALASNSGDSHRDLNIPRGRQERSGSFSRTYSKLTDKADTAKSSKSSTSRRSSSHSRVTDFAAKEDKHQPRSYEKSGYSTEGLRASPRDSHNTNRTEPRQHGSSRSSHSSNVPDRKSPFNRSSSSLDKSSSERLSTTSTAGKTTPHIKPSLTDTGKLKAKTYRSSQSDYTPSKLALYSYDKTDPNSSKDRSKESRYDDDENDMDFGMRSLPANLHSETHRERFLNISSSEKADVCAICLSEVTMPKELEKCKHKFCTDCIDQHFRMSKPTCPTCGTIYGAIVGDQPKNGRMEYQTKRDLLLPGYEKEDGAIVITYTFPSGKQDSTHPIPGQPYKGMERKAYLPNSREGREILRLLQKAFDARLMFTIGMSRTTGKEGVLTWNDIHHKTSIHGGPVKFGYPDPDYLRRVRDELAAKGIVSSRY